MLSILLKCFLCVVSRLSNVLAVSPQVPQLYSRIGVIRASYSLSLFCSLMIVRCHMLFSELNASWASVRLFSTSSFSSIRLPSFLVFFHSLVLRLTLVYSVFASFTFRFDSLRVFAIIVMLFLASSSVSKSGLHRQRRLVLL